MMMNEAIGMSCNDTDIISTMKARTNCTFVHTTTRSPWKLQFEEKLSESLTSASSAADFPLLPIQMKAVNRIIYRPEATVKFQPRPESTDTPRLFSTALSDLRAPVILDMPTGTGKTITAMMGCILFTIARKADMERGAFIGPTVCGVTEVTGVRGIDPSAPQVSNKCIIFTPRHLVQHWADHGAIAKRIVEGMTFENGSKWSVRIIQNKLASSVTVAPNEVLVVICDSSACRINKYLEPTVYYSAVCFDEVGERDTKVNAMFQHPALGVKFLYGRAVLCSADFAKWGWAGFDVGPRTLLRSIFPEWGKFVQPREVVATAVTAAIFDESERETVMAACTSKLDSTVVDMATIQYHPSLLENLGLGYGVDLGNDKGCDMFEQKYGVCVEGCSTIYEVLEAITEVISSTTAKANHATQFLRIASKINMLETLKVKIHEAVSDDCPICFEHMYDIALIQPCLHFTCKSCMSKIYRSCPLCRGGLHGTVGVSTEDRPIKKARATRPTEGGGVVCEDVNDIVQADARIGDLFYDEMATLCPRDPVGVSHAIQTTLDAVQSAREKSNRAHKTLRTMIICPGTELREGLFQDAGFEVFHYKTSGTKSSPVTRKRMNTLMQTFKQDDGKSKLLCVRDAGIGGKEDSMTGLDLILDCVIAIGAGNLAQRLGRLCRLSRVTLPEEERHALYVQIVPRSN